MTRPAIDMDYVVLDCPDTAALASFYGKMLGWNIIRSDEDWTILQGPGNLKLAFQLAEDFVPLEWPSEGIKTHLDLVVDDMAASEEFVVGLGATKVTGPLDQPSFTVFRDPVGHLFCLCLR